MKFEPSELVWRPGDRIIPDRELRSVKGIPWSKATIRRQRMAGNFPPKFPLSDRYPGSIERLIDKCLAERARSGEVHGG